uniref:Uncharacterized protein n=1 Tax=Arundo donax TaxID=35708 RepID=A0A0A9HDA9_ARUDO
MLPALRSCRRRPRHPRLEQTTMVAGDDRTLVNPGKMPCHPLCSSPDTLLLKQIGRGFRLSRMRLADSRTALRPR